MLLFFPISNLTAKIQNQQSANYSWFIMKDAYIHSYFNLKQM